MKRLTEEQVELAERYAVALKTAERLQHMLPADKDIEQLGSYVQNLAYAVQHADELTEADREMAEQYAGNLSEINRLAEECLDKQSEEMAAQYAGNLHEINRLYDDCMNEDAAERAATYAQNLRDIAELV